MFVTYCHRVMFRMTDRDKAGLEELRALVPYGDRDTSSVIRWALRECLKAAKAAKELRETGADRGPGQTADRPSDKSARSRKKLGRRKTV